MITATIIICLTVILIVAIICYKEYKLSNNCSFVTIECDLKSLSRKLELNNSILESLAESISYPPKESKNKNDMKRELQDYVWSVLPKEFKEEVKYKYNKTKTKKIKKECDLGFLNAHEGMFGAHNLTSDAKGEEMLTVPRKKVKEKWQRACEQEAKYGRAQDSPVAREELYYNRGILSILDTLFGSKCLPDELNEDNFATKKPQPAEPKFKVGDKVRIKGCGYEPKLHKGDIGEILDTNDKEQCFVLFKKSQAWIYIDCLEPYTEPTANYMQVDYHGADTAASTIADDCQSQPVTDDFDRIIKDGFRGHNRLHIAAQIVAALYSNHQAAKDFKSIEELVRKALDIADTLIKESEKGGEA